MNPTLAALLGTVVGGSASLLGTWLTGTMTARRERSTRLYSERRAVYASLLEHIEDLRVSAFSDNMAFAPYTKDPDRMLMAKYTAWYLDLEVHAPAPVREQSDKVMNTLGDLGEAREEAWMHSPNPENASQFDIETAPGVGKAHERVIAERAKLLELIRKDLDVKVSRR